MAQNRQALIFSVYLLWATVSYFLNQRVTFVFVYFATKYNKNTTMDVPIRGTTRKFQGLLPLPSYFFI